MLERYICKCVPLGHISWPRYGSKNNVSSKAALLAIWPSWQDNKKTLRPIHADVEGERGENFQRCPWSCSRSLAAQEATSHHGGGTQVEGNVASTLRVAAAASD